MFSLSNMPSTTAVLSVYTTVTASAVLVRTLVYEVQNLTNQLLPKNYQEKFLSKFGFLLGNFSTQMSLIIEENSGHIPNEVFEASMMYLSTIQNPSTLRLKVTKAEKDKNLSVAIGEDEKIMDTFEGMQLIWEFKIVEAQRTSSENAECRLFELSFNRKYKEMVLNSYLPFVLERSKAIKEENKMIVISTLGSYSYSGYGEGSVNLDHPSTFETLAMDPKLKKDVIDDLDRFIRRREYYRRVGKAWKRGYLLYGPPGTGKSSLIAAMANYLKFDIYDLELSSLQSNADLRSLLVSTKNRSILVIEDIDCSIELQNRNACAYNQTESQITLSGLLNFVDGLWSSCGDERIIVFTTNYRERLDPALLRPGRMDMHIHMSYCTPGGFRVLASNYLAIKTHCKFSEIDELVTEVNVTPAEIAEELMKSNEADISLEGLVNFLHEKKMNTAIGNDEVHEIEQVKEADSKVMQKRRGKARKRRNTRR